MTEVIIISKTNILMFHKEFYDVAEKQFPNIWGSFSQQTAAEVNKIFPTAIKHSSSK